MAIGRKTGGRTLGTPNKRTATVTEKLEALGCDPIEAMAKMAMDETTPLAIRVTLLRELAEYMWPKRKAVQLLGVGPTGAQVVPLPLPPANWLPD